MKQCKLCCKKKKHLTKNSFFGMICKQCQESISTTGVNSDYYITTTNDPSIIDVQKPNKKIHK